MIISEKSLVLESWASCGGFLHVSDAALVAGVSVVRIRALIDHGRFCRHVLFGRHVVAWSELSAWINSVRKPGRPKKRK